MRRWGIVLVALAALGRSVDAGAATAALQSRPATTDRGTSLWVRGTITNLTRADLIVTVRARGRARIVCVDRRGRIPPHSAREVAVVAASVRSMSPAAVVRGTAVFDMIAGPPTIGSPSAAGCPDDQWTAHVEDVAFRTVTVRVTQSGRVVLDQTLRL